MSIHIFETEIAAKYGIEAAILLQNISFWIEKNKANEKHFHDGKYWTYNSVRAFSELFSYMSESTIRRNLLKLETEGLVETGNYNSLSFDRTCWYTTTEKGLFILNKSICQFEQTHLVKTSNPINQKEGTIPDINTDIKPDNKKDIYDLNFTTFYESYPRKTGKSAAFKAFKSITKKGAKLEDILFCLNHYKKEISLLKTDAMYIKHPSTFLNCYEDWREETTLGPRKEGYQKPVVDRSGGISLSPEVYSAPKSWDQ